MTALSNAPHQTDPRELSPVDLGALERIAGGRYRRVTGGWRCPGQPDITRRVADRLIYRGLVRAVAGFRGGNQTLEITGNGRNTLAVAEQRRHRR